LEQRPGAASSSLVVGALCGAVAAACWAIGFVAARHGVLNGLTPPDIAFHRFVWTGLFLLPVVWQAGLRDLGGIGWGRGLIMMLLAGPTQAMASATGFTLTPLGHGAVIQPASSALGSVVLAALVLHEHLSRRRAFGVGVIVLGLSVFGGDAVRTIGTHGVIGDLIFVSAGLAWAVFGTLLRRWRIEGMRGAVTVGALSVLVYAPVHAVLFGFGSMVAAGLWENLLQVAGQGVAGAFAIFLFTRAVTLLGGGRGGVFAALVPGFALVIGVAALGEVPTLMQLVGFAVVMVGFRFVLKQ
jgi:drug/metabolite transporter (DMT)-like permease